jgi:hypothetical protein
VSEKGGVELTTKLWEVWKKGRNQVFHYFPHNFRRLSYQEAFEIADDIAKTMEQAINRANIFSLTHRNQKST